MTLDFTRPEGFAGSHPRDWIDRELPRCPFCEKEGPRWEIAVQPAMRLNRYHFRCPRCHGILSIPVASVGSARPGLSLMGIRAATSGRFVIEDVGTSGSTQQVGRELSAEELLTSGDGSIDGHRPSSAPPLVNDFSIIKKR